MDWSDPKTFWLNVTNIGLGIVVLACVVALVRALFQEASLRMKRRAKAFERADDHSFLLPSLGWTMADGGARLEGGSKTDFPDIHADEEEPNIYRSVN